MLKVRANTPKTMIYKVHNGKLYVLSNGRFKVSEYSPSEIPLKDPPKKVILSRLSIHNQKFFNGLPCSSEITWDGHGFKFKFHDQYFITNDDGIDKEVVTSEVGIKRYSGSTTHRLKFNNKSRILVGDDTITLTHDSVRSPYYGYLHVNNHFGNVVGFFERLGVVYNEEVIAGLFGSEEGGTSPQWNTCKGEADIIFNWVVNAFDKKGIEYSIENG